MITLASTAELLVSGGDSRITPDPITGVNKYGCSVTPDPTLTALGSSTASVISDRGMAAANVLRDRCAKLLQHATPEAVYEQQICALRAELLALCGVTPDINVDALFAASGTDVHLILGQWLKPDLTLMIDPAETGSGLVAALTGKHFSTDSTCTGSTPTNGQVGQWQGELKTFAARNLLGQPIAPALVEEAMQTVVEQAVKEDRQILLILTDVCKTGILFPDINVVLRLRDRWPEQIHVVVDACQFRLSPHSIRAYLAQDFCVALTGSKFLGGPTFSGALLIPNGFSTSCQGKVLDEGVGAYAYANEWPTNHPAASQLKRGANFGLLLRWEAAMSELRLFSALKDTQLRPFFRRFKEVVTNYLQQNPHFEVVPNPRLDRSNLVSNDTWDNEQSIFPFVVYQCLEDGTRRPLSRKESLLVYQQLQHPTAHSQNRRRFQLGQPVLCGERDGVPVSALRLCISAPMLIAAQDSLMAETIINDATMALDYIAEISDGLLDQKNL